MPAGKQPISNEKLTTIILAAGKGKRMYSKKSKILHEILGKPLISFVVELAQEIRSNEIVIVVGKNAERVRKIFGNRVRYALQSMPRGTGDAAKKGIAASANGNVLILCGDVPLLQRETLARLIKHHKRKNADLTLLTCEVKNPYGYGRIMRNRRGDILGIIEQSDATADQLKIQEINAGIYYGRKKTVLSALNRITANNRQGELYLTDVVREMIGKRKKVFGLKIHNEQEILGINSKIDLARAREIIRFKWFDQLMARGVYIEDPQSTIIDLAVKIGKYVQIRPHTIIEGKTTIKDGTTVGPFVWIRDGKKVNYTKNV